MTRLWEDPQPPHFYASPAVGEDGNVFVARDDDHLVAYDRYGNRLWTEDFVGANDFISSPALFPFLNAAFFVYVPTRERMYKVNAGNGALFEEHPVTYATCASPAITLDRVYVGTPGGLLSMDFFLGDLQKDATVEVQNASPAIGADGSVYIVTRKGDLIAYRNPEEL
jgi:outer membrane protein assembly factor BamB